MPKYAGLSSVTILHKRHIMVFISSVLSCEQYLVEGLRGTVRYDMVLCYLGIFLSEKVAGFPAM